MKRIIVLDRSTSESEANYNCLFWFQLSSGIRTQSAGSAWVPNGSSVGASAGENQAIQAGTILEESHSFQFPVATPITDIENVMLQAWTNRNQQINGVGPNQFYGSFNDSVSGWATA